MRNLTRVLNSFVHTSHTWRHANLHSYLQLYASTFMYSHVCIYVIHVIFRSYYIHIEIVTNENEILLAKNII